MWLNKDKHAATKMQNKCSFHFLIKSRCGKQHFLQGVILKLDSGTKPFPLTGSHEGELVYFLSNALPPSGKSLFGLHMQGQNIRDKESFIIMLKQSFYKLYLF